MVSKGGVEVFAIEAEGQRGDGGKTVIGGQISLGTQVPGWPQPYDAGLTMPGGDHIDGSPLRFMRKGQGGDGRLHFLLSANEPGIDRV